MPIPNLKPHPYSEIFPLMMMDMFSAAISRGSRSYLTARMADLTLGTPQRGRWAVQPYRLTREELKTCPNYRFLPVMASSQRAILCSQIHPIS